MHDRLRNPKAKVVFPVDKTLPTADAIKDWLQNTGRTYAWYAAQLGVRIGTVNQWLKTKNPSPIPEIALRATFKLMRPEMAADGEISAEEMVQLLSISRDKGIGIVQLCVELIREQLNLEVAAANQKAAEQIAKLREPDTELGEALLADDELSED